MSEADLQQRVRSATIFARTMPEQKLRIVNALKANGEVVAMTGDGVNDAPSLKAAHIGIAMGGRGTDVAREAASLILLDDDFTSIVTAVRLGRRIYDNLRKAMAYILAVHVPIAGLALIPLLFDLPLVFWPLHIAFLEMVIDPVCSIVFEAEAKKPTPCAGRRVIHPRPSSPPGFVIWSLLQGALVLALVAGLFVMALRQNLPEPDARSLAFAALVATNLGLVLVNRSLERIRFCRVHAAQCGAVVGGRGHGRDPRRRHSLPAGARIVPFRAAARRRYRCGAGQRLDRSVAARAGKASWCSHCSLRVIRKPGPSSDEPIRRQREPTGNTTSTIIASSAGPGSPTSPWKSRSLRKCRPIAAGSASSPATRPGRRPISICRSSSSP